MLDLIASVWTALCNLSAIPFIIGIIVFVIAALGAFWRVVKALWRFGLALHGKKIYIVSDDDSYQTLSEDLSDSGLLKKKNLTHINKHSFNKKNGALLLIVQHGYLETEDLRLLLKNKDARCGAIVYCPPGAGRLENAELDLLNSVSFTTLCNFRGRLVNDVLLMMLSTSFKKSDM